MYRSKHYNQDHVIVDRGVPVTPLDKLLEGRLTVEGSELILKDVTLDHTGVFKVTDLDGFPVAFYDIDVDGKKKRHI